MSDSGSDRPKAKTLADGIEVWCAHDRLVPVEELRPNPRNPNSHPPAQLDLLAKNIRYFGWRRPCSVSNLSGFIVAGHGRLLAAKQLGVRLVPVEYQDFANIDEELAVLVADNSLADLAETSEDDLKALLKDLDGKLDLELTGLPNESIEDLLRTFEGDGDDDAVPAPPDEPATKPGDILVLGPHRLMCGDSGSLEDLDRLLDGARIHLLNTDPPYNVKVEPRSMNAIAAGNSSFGGFTGHHQRFDAERLDRKVKRTTAKMRAKDRPLANDFVSDEAFDAMLRAWFGNAARVMEPGRSFYIWGGYANLGNYPLALKDCGLYFSQAIIWDKEHPVLTRKDFMGAFEIAFYGWLEGAGHHFFGPNNATDLWHVKKVTPQKMVHLCLHPDAVVLTEAGWRPIRSIKAGDRVYSGDGRFHAVEHVSSHRYASEHLYRIAAEGGDETTDASDNHPFLIWRGGQVSWVRADRLRFGDHTMTPLPADGSPDPCPAAENHRTVDHDGRRYRLRAVESVQLVRYDGDVWNLSVEGDPTFQTAVGLSHNTEKPVELASRAMSYSSRPGENVLDLFGGSGSTLVGAERMGRKSFLMELDPLYCDVIARRWVGLGEGRTVVRDGEDVTGLFREPVPEA